MIGRFSVSRIGVLNRGFDQNLNSNFRILESKKQILEGLSLHYCGLSKDEWWWLETFSTKNTYSNSFKCHFLIRIWLENVKFPRMQSSSEVDSICTVGCQRMTLHSRSVFQQKIIIWAVCSEHFWSELDLEIDIFEFHICSMFGLVLR